MTIWDALIALGLLLSSGFTAAAGLVAAQSHKYSNLGMLLFLCCLSNAAITAAMTIATFLMKVM